MGKHRQLWKTWIVMHWVSAMFVVIFDHKVETESLWNTGLEKKNRKYNVDIQRKFHLKILVSLWCFKD